MTIRLTASRLCVARGREIVAGPLDFRLESGEALVVTGENGAGKSTLLRTLAGLLPVGGGTIALEGARAADNEPATRLSEVAHYLGHRNAMKATIGVGENLAYWSRLLGGGGTSVAQALEAVGLPDVAATPFGYLSAGQQRRVAFARLLVAHRPVWLLDEPTAALDAGSQARVAVLLQTHLGAGGLVVAATHQALGIGAQGLHLSGSVRLSPTRPLVSDEDLAAAEGWS